MAENERLKKVILWLISQEIVSNQENLARKMGYNPSSLSQIVTGVKPVSKKFANNLARISEKININYLFGDKEMFNENKKEETETSTLIQIIHSQQKTIEMLAGKVVGM